MSPKEKADATVAAVQEALKDFPAFLLFCTGEDGGFLCSSIEDKTDEKMQAQIYDSLIHNNNLRGWLKNIVDQADAAVKNAPLKFITNGEA